jgi:shikimate kinase
MKKIFLIGLPGSGKTTIGKQLAERLKLSFVDLDKAIESTVGKKVEEIFKEKSEPGFRKLESEVLQQYCQQSEIFVMATGGGAPCFSDNIQVMKKSGTVIFLDVPPKTISDRIIHEVAHRPILKHETPDSLKDRIEFLRSQRISFYKQAHHTISGDNISAITIARSLENS